MDTSTANDSTMFILPMLYSQTKDISNINNLLSDLQGCYIAEVDKPDEYKIIALSNTQPVGFSNYINSNNNRHYFNIPNEYKSDFDLFLNGSYSKFSPIHKLNICKFWNLDQDHLWYNIIMKTDRLRNYLAHRYNIHETLISNEAEYWNKPVLSKETI